jgi:MFS family permease
VFDGSIFLAWMPTYLKREFGMSLALAGLNATLWLQAASVLGVVAGGWLADALAAKTARGRVLVQAAGLFLGAPLIFLAGWTRDVAVLVPVLAGFGFFKGMYDANTWAALYDVVSTRRRSTALGLVNGLGWLLGGATAPVLIAYTAGRWGFGASISAVSAVYVATGLLLVGGAVAFLPRGPLPAPPVGR